MPSVSPSYLYTFIAMLAVGSLLVFSFMAYVNATRFSSETKQLKNLMDYVAARSTELVTLALTTNETAQSCLQMPVTIGSRQYWLQLQNDSENVWIEGGFGDTALEGTGLRIYLPKEANATGYYVGGYGAAYLSCVFSFGVPQLRLENLNEGS